MSSKITMAQAFDALQARVKALSEADRDTDSEEIMRLRDKVLDLGVEVKRLQDRRNIAEPDQLTPAHPTSRSELMVALHELAAAIGGLEASQFHLPPETRALRRFRCSIRWTRSKQLADERYLGVHGNYDKDSRKSSWQVREVNRKIHDREGVWGKLGVYLAFALGLVSIGVATMAIPTEKSFYCRFAERFHLDSCDTNPLP